MRSAKILLGNQQVGVFTEIDFGKKYRFEYLLGYSGAPVSLTMPLNMPSYEFDKFPPFFDGLLPEGYQLDGLLKFGKIDRNDFFSQLMAVGDDLVGNVTVKEITQ